LPVITALLIIIFSTVYYWCYCKS